MIGWFQVSHRQPDRRLGGARSGHAGPRRRAGRHRARRGRRSRCRRKRTLSRTGEPHVLHLFSVVIGAWLCVMMYGTYVWNLCLAYYRVLGIGMIASDPRRRGALLAGSGQARNVGSRWRRSC